VRNHDQKIKDMQRSVLPSTGRKAARDERCRIHQSARTRERGALRALDGAGDPDDFDPDFREGRRKSRTKSMVLDRQAGDKLGPLTRWAVRIVQANHELRDAALHEQVAYFQTRLPGDLIGQHAASHIEFALRWEFHRDIWRRGWRRPPSPSRDERRAQVAHDAAPILEGGRHRELNAALRRAFEIGAAGASTGRRFRRWDPAAEPPASRLLLGLHDVDAFAAEISRHPWLCEVVAGVAGRLGSRSVVGR
jgi:hypothetical protein